MSDVQTSATIASLRAEVERLKAELQGERDDVAACRAEVNRLSKYAERLLAENVQLTNRQTMDREEIESMGRRNDELLADLADARKWIDGQDVRSDFPNATAMRAALDRERELVREWNVLVAQGCTPGGSEFHDCPQNVAYYIKERLADKDRIMKSQQKDLNRERERCGVLEAEVRAWRHWNRENDKVGGDDEVDANANAAWGLLECCQRETDRTNALDAAKFGGAT